MPAKYIGGEIVAPFQGAMPWGITYPWFAPCGHSPGAILCFAPLGRLSRSAAFETYPHGEQSVTEMMRAGEGGIAALVESIQEPFRGLEIIQPLKNGKAILLTKSKIAPWTAEWVANIVASVLPAATLDEIIWQYPATLVFHLVAAAARKSGGSTRRPESHESIMDALGKLASTGVDNTEPPTTSDTAE